jgi:membrane protein required for colicin V production
MQGLGWPDLLIAGIVLIGALMGLKRGFISALTGFVAVAIAVFAAFRYNGMWDGWVGALTRLGPGSAHVVAMVLFAIVAYALTVAAGVFFARIAKLPGLNLVNAILGAGVGALEAVALLWLVIYIALFFPLSADLRADLHRSSFVAALAAPNAQVDGSVRSLLPWIARPFVAPFFDNHKP